MHAYECGSAGPQQVLPPGSIRTTSLIYLDEHDVPYEYEAIALVHARGDDDWTDEGDMIQAMREEAAKLGAHAIIIEWIEEPGALEHVIDHRTHADTANRRGKVVAIRAVGG